MTNSPRIPVDQEQIDKINALVDRVGKRLAEISNNFTKTYNYDEIGIDIHTESAKILFRTETPSPEERTAAKRFNLSLMFIPSMQADRSE